MMGWFGFFQPTISDNSDGSYTVMYTATPPGLYEISVFASNTKVPHPTLN